MPVNECLAAGEEIDMREIRKRVWNLKSEMVMGMWRCMMDV